MYLCEYLPRLRTISTIIDFDHNVKLITNISLRDHQLILSVADQDPIVVELPQETSLKNELQLTNLKKTNNAIAITLKLQGEPPVENFMNLLDFQLWSCKDLLKTPKNEANVNEFKLLCGNCHEVIIDSADYSRFSDMPSSLWVEMMDFWHCHKPNDASQSNTSKDFNGDLVLNPNGILIGNYYFLIRNSDIRKQLITKNAKQTCSCGQVLGEITSKNCVKLYKWSLKLSYDSILEDYPAYLYIYNLILDKINLQAIRKLMINDYVIWIFNIGQSVTVNDLRLVNSLKILYFKPQEPSNRISDDEITVEDDIFQNFLSQLNKVNDSLPEDCKKVSLQEDENLIDYKISYLGVYK